ncbi:sensor histidine kinase [Nocardioides sp. Bht2]|uniref:sensor histidine kinase n=1 Tax=Nocardioides sp. Bht2 TaxID=3392297 RepID=UPI0039B3753D
MRERLIAALVGMTIAMIALYGVPRAYLLADLVNDQEHRKIERSAELLAVVVDERTSAQAPVTSDFLAKMLNKAESIEYRGADGTVVRAGSPNTGDHDIVQTRTLSDGSTVTLSRDGKLIDQRISDALLPLILIGLGLVVLAVIVGYLLARRLARPFGELAQAADELGEGRFEVDLPRYSIPEADAIGLALSRASDQLDELVQREREFAANASHQLRTPITALRLTLEDLTMWPETPPSVAEELTANLGELDRLSAAITELLELARGKRLGEAIDFDLGRLSADAVDRWLDHAAERGHSLVHAATGTFVAHAVPGPVSQILDVLIENACNHGVGVITVELRNLDHYLSVTVADDGPRTISNEVFERGTSSADSDGHGLGLTIASQLATSLGGHLSLAETESTTFVLLLPQSGRSAP